MLLGDGLQGCNVVVERFAGLLFHMRPDKKLRGFRLGDEGRHISFVQDFFNPSLFLI